MVGNSPTQKLTDIISKINKSLQVRDMEEIQRDRLLSNQKTDFNSAY